LVYGFLFGGKLGKRLAIVTEIISTIDLNAQMERQVKGVSD
jgi:hypothetical protein